MKGEVFLIGVPFLSCEACRDARLVRPLQWFVNCQPDHLFMALGERTSRASLHQRLRFSLHTVRMHAHTLCRRQIVDAPPAHLQQAETRDEHGESGLRMGGFIAAIVNIGQIRKPCDGGPSLFRVPSPVVSPSFLGPQCTHEHAERDERQAYIDEVVGDIEFFFGSIALLDEQQINGHYHGCPEQGIGHHVDNDVGREPRTLQCGH